MRKKHISKESRIPLANDPYAGAPHRLLGDGRVLVLYPLLFGAQRLVIGPADDPTGYDRGFDYPREECIAAVYSFKNWDGDGYPPAGWVREIGTGLRVDLKTGRMYQRD